MSQLFWDSSELLTKTYQDIANLLEQLKTEWKGCRVFATLEVAALLLDISSFEHFIAPQGNEGEEVKRKIANLGYERRGNEIHLSIGCPNSMISGEMFGRFQALCAELVVPLKQEAIEAMPEKKTFLELTGKCDLLDFPGVSKKDTGANTDDSCSLLDLQQVTSKDIYTKVFKQGKTQCFVYYYARQYGIDAFAMLVQTREWPAKSSLLNAGIAEWLLSFDPNWKAGLPTALPIFLNLTFFSSLINSISQSGIGSGLAPYADRILGELNFAQNKSVHFFATTYPQFPGQGSIEENFKQSKDSTIKAILNDSSFREAFDIGQENLEAVYDEDGGVDYMLRCIAKTIDMSLRKRICQKKLAEDKQVLLRMLREQLPPDEDMELEERKRQLLDCAEEIQEVISRIEDDGNADDFMKFSFELKQLFASSAGLFDPIPTNLASRGSKECKAFIKSQLARWFAAKVQNLDDQKFLSLRTQRIILSALRDAVDMQMEPLQQMLKDRFGGIPNRPIGEAARYPFSLTLSNFLLHGSYGVDCSEQIGDCKPMQLEKFIEAEHKQDASRNGSPYHYSILQPVVGRLQSLADNTTKVSRRPPQDGDAELATLVEELEASNMFEII